MESESERLGRAVTQAKERWEKEKSGSNRLAYLAAAKAQKKFWQEKGGKKVLGGASKDWEDKEERQEVKTETQLQTLEKKAGDGETGEKSAVKK